MEFERTIKAIRVIMQKFQRQSQPGSRYTVHSISSVKIENGKHAQTFWWISDIFTFSLKNGWSDLERMFSNI